MVERLFRGYLRWKRKLRWWLFGKNPREREIYEYYSRMTPFLSMAKIKFLPSSGMLAKDRKWFSTDSKPLRLVDYSYHLQVADPADPTVKGSLTAHTHQGSTCAF
jgi:hypothetical protein